MNWTIDGSHSLAEFSVKHMMVATVKGRFQNFSGNIVWDETNPANSSVEATLEVSSITTNDEKRDGHLASADFFETEKYPTITFVSKKVEAKSGEEFKVTGDLTMHGITKEVVLDVDYNGTGKNPWGMTVAGFSARTSVNRKDFGLNWNVALEAGGMLVSEKINISLEIEAVAAPVEVTA
ncbi:MAG: YceI family protein [Chloroflexi bacterium]|jgi:polyisoprenoid-binding protein YceI|nr:YceI family protein [Chloroflexota bacterium]